MKMFFFVEKRALGEVVLEGDGVCREGSMSIKRWNFLWVFSLCCGLDKQQRDREDEKKGRRSSPNFRFSFW